MKYDFSHITKILIAATLVIYVMGCSVGPKYERPEITSPDRFRNDTLAETDSIVNLKWWELFNDPILDSLILEALNNNKDVKIAASRIEQSRAQLGINRADFYPQIDLAGGVIRGNYLPLR